MALKFKPALHWKLILSVSALIMLTSITLGWFAGQYAVDLIKNGLMDRGRSLARNLAYNSEYGVLIGSQEVLTQLLDGVIRQEDVSYAVVSNEAGELLASARFGQLAEIPHKSTARIRLQPTSWTDSATLAYEIPSGQEVFYEIVYPIKTRQVRREREEIGLTMDETLGTGTASAAERTIGTAAVGMSLSLKRVNATVISILTSIALLTVLVILAGIGVTVVLAKVIAGPVKQLAEAARQIAEGDLHSQVAVRSRDEIGDLADSFNRMADSVWQRENALREINAQLEEASRNKSQFLANMSHELRTPLNAILGFTGILLKDAGGNISPEERQEFLSNIRTSGRHLLGLINEVLDLSKIDAGKMELKRENFSLPDVLEGIRQTVEPLARKKRIALEMRIDSRLSTLSADEVRFREILFNLLSNAIKFTRDAGHVRVQADARDGWAEFSVADNGIGIKPEDRARIFQEFEQVEMSAERRFEGTGLGLTLAKKFVELHGGKIWLESEVDKGSTFYFTLPLDTSTEKDIRHTKES